MDPLLDITSVPIDIEINIKRASFELQKEKGQEPTPTVHISRDKGEFRIDAEPLKINIDNTRMYESMGYKRPSTVGSDNGDKGFSLSYQGTARIVNEGYAVAEGKADAASIAASNTARASRSLEAVTSWLPKDGPDISWSGGKLNISYTPDQLNMDWNIAKAPSFKFVPGSVEFIINQLPKVEIEYTGDPIYFPASAAPDFEK